MDILAINAQFSLNWNSLLDFMKFNRTIFKQYPSSYWPSVGVWINTEFFSFMTNHKVLRSKRGFWPIRQQLTEPCSRQRILCTIKILQICWAIFPTLTALQHLVALDSGPLRVALELWLSIYLHIWWFPVQWTTSNYHQNMLWLKIRYKLRGNDIKMYVM